MYLLAATCLLKDSYRLLTSSFQGAQKNLFPLACKPFPSRSFIFLDTQTLDSFRTPSRDVNRLRSAARPHGRLALQGARSLYVDKLGLLVRSCVVFFIAV